LQTFLSTDTVMQVKLDEYLFRWSVLVELNNEHPIHSWTKPSGIASRRAVNYESIVWSLWYDSAKWSNAELKFDCRYQHQVDIRCVIIIIIIFTLLLLK